jgi:hypothetical protein
MEAKGFFQSLFDVSFSSLITTRVIKFIYILTMVLIGLGALVFAISAFAADPIVGIFVLLIVAPLGALVYIVYARVFLEIIIAIFRIMETNVELVALQRQAGGASPAPGGTTSSPGAGTPPSSGPAPTGGAAPGGGASPGGPPAPPPSTPPSPGGGSPPSGPPIPPPSGG